MGCRQILGIEDGTVLAPVGHDEDADGIDDGLDNCPADSNPSQSATEAGIGTVCDPHPEDEGDRLALFLSFYPTGRPDAIDEEPGVSYDADAATVDDATLRTRSSFTPSVISADLRFGSFVGEEATLTMTVGGHTCRIASCGSRICLQGGNGAMTGSMEFTPSSFEVTLALVQADTMLACVLTKQAVVVSLPATAVASDAVSIDVQNAMMYVESLAIYEVD